MSTAARNPIVSTEVRTAVVNRTHRVVRERARVMQAQRSRNRALWAPILVASSLVIVLISAFWLMFDEYEMLADNATDGKFHLPILLIWFLPVTGALLIMAVMKRFKSASGNSSLHQENR
jgi:zinc transporter ZupT